MDAMFMQLKKLYDNELYPNVLPIACIMKSAYNLDRSLLTPEQYFLLLVYNANSLFHQQQYRKADLTYREALIARKALSKTKPSTVLAHNFENMTDQFPDCEIRYKVALCLDMEKKNTEAISMLQSIPVKQRTMKVNMLLGKLCERANRDSNAISALKSVLKECPMNLEAIKLLMSLSVTALEINVIIAESNLPAQCSEWLNGWIDTYTSMYRCRFTEAISKLQALETKSIYAKNEVFGVLIGQCFHFNGDFDNALEYMSRAYANNPYLLDGITTLASLYALKDKSKELEKLTQPTLSPAEYKSEYWFIWAQYLANQGKYEKATYFAHKACYLNSSNIEAALLKAKIFLELKKYKEAILQFKVLLKFAAHRFEVYEGLVVCHIATHHFREAQLVAGDAVRILGKNPRTYVLVARPLLSDPAMKYKSKAFLEKAIELNKNYLPAVLLLVDYLQGEGDLVNATNLLKRTVAVQPTSQIFTYLGDLYTLQKDPLLALECYTKAINMDPANRKASTGLLSLEQNMQPKEEGSSNYSPTLPAAESSDNNFEMMEAQQMTPPNDALLDIEEESETLWADVDIETN